MTDVGYDAAWGPPDPNAAYAAGYRFVSRYLSYDPSKDITTGELQADRRAGLEVSLNWENYGDWQHDFSGGAATGRQHALDAVAQAEAVGYPKGETIYFSADFDATEAQQPTINAYFQAAAEVCHAAGFRCGIYGGYYVVMRTLNANVGVDDAWQTYAWSGGQWDPRAAIRQDQNGITIAGASVDHDTRVGRTYLMGGQIDMPLYFGLGATGDFVTEMQADIAACGVDIAVDGVYGAKTAAALMQAIHPWVGGDSSGNTFGWGERCELKKQLARAAVKQAGLAGTPGPAGPAGPMGPTGATGPKGDTAVLAAGTTLKVE